MKAHLTSISLGSLVMCSLLPAQQAKPVIDAANAVPKQKMTDGVVSPNLKGEAIVAHYRLWTGKQVIASKAALAKSISFIQPDPMSYQDAVRILEKTCKLEGLFFIPSGDEVKFLTAAEAKSQGMQIITLPELLPVGDQVVSYQMKLQYIEPADALRAFQSVYGATKSHGSVTVVEHARSIIVTESADLIRSLIKLKNKLDIPQSQVIDKMIELSNADAEELADQLTAIIESQIESRNRISAAQATPRATPRGATTTRGSSQKTNQIKQVNITGVKRTNSIFVMARPVDMVFVESLIKKFDKPISQRNSTKFRLNYVAVADFLEVADSSIRRTIGEANFENRSISQAGPVRSQTSSSQSAASGGDLAASIRPNQPITRLVGKTLLIADSANNTLIVQGPPQSLEVVKGLVKDMDIAAKQVQISAVFGRYSMDGERSLGVDFARTFTQSQNGEGGAANTNTGFPFVIDPSNLINPSAFPLPSSGAGGLNLYGQLGRNFFGYLRALETQGKFRLLSTPTIFTTNNNVATLSSGQRIAVPTSSVSDNTGNTASLRTNIEFRDVLLSMEVLPLINANNEVTLTIKFKNENIVGNQTVGGDSIPTIGAEEFTTTIKVPNNGVVALGGLITERLNKSKTGVPLLSKVPGVGKLFQSNTTSTTKEELVIMIQPKIVENMSALKKLQNSNSLHSELRQEATNSLLPPLDSDDLAPESEKVKSPRRRFRAKRR